MLIYLVIVVATAVLAGLTAALTTAVVSDLVVNFFFVPPYRTFTVESRDHVITLVVYIAVAVTVSLAMHLAASRRAEAARSGIEAELLARISAAPVGQGSVRSLLAHVRDTLHMDTAALVETTGEGTPRIVAINGAGLTAAPQLSVPADATLILVVDGPARGTREKAATCASTSATCVANSNPTPNDHAICAPTPASAIDSRPTSPNDVLSAFVTGGYGDRRCAGKSGRQSCSAVDPGGLR